MSQIFETIKQRITLATKARDQPRKDIYRFLKGKLDLLPKLDDEAATKVIRTLLKDAKENPTQFSDLEVAEMNSLVPKLLDMDQTMAALDDAVCKAIREAKSDGHAQGVAMKTLKGNPIDPDIVRYIIGKLRESN